MLGESERLDVSQKLRLLAPSSVGISVAALVHKHEPESSQWGRSRILEWDCESPSVGKSYHESGPGTKPNCGFAAKPCKR
jgi:hypothetical protein